MKMNKKGTIFENLGALATGIAALAIVLVVAFLIIANGRTQIQTTEGLANLNDTECQKSLACNATGTLRGAISTIPGWVPLIVIAVIGSILLGLVAMFKGK